MDHVETGRYWNGNADRLDQAGAVAGYDVYRDHLNTPAFFEFLPDVVGKSGYSTSAVARGINCPILPAPFKTPR